MNLKNWIKAARLRTLPLSFSSILFGSGIAQLKESFSFPILSLTLLTTLFLQILSNFANDYGDAKNGADHEEREGPKRMVSSGAISLKSMGIAVFLFSILSFISGISLLLIAFDLNQLPMLLLFLLLGLGAIWAAIKYTVGKNPYGYAGLGDLFVLIFFGFTGVLGTLYLHSKSIALIDTLPALSLGLLAVGVLNVNNMRDIDSDKIAGKNSIPVRIGLGNAKNYHLSLVIISMSSLVLWSLNAHHGIYSWAYLMVFIPLTIHLIRVMKTNKLLDFDPQLKVLALSSFGISLIFFISVMI